MKKNTKKQIQKNSNKKKNTQHKLKNSKKKIYTILNKTQKQSSRRIKNKTRNKIYKGGDIYNKTNLNNLNQWGKTNFVDWLKKYNNWLTSENHVPDFFPIPIPTMPENLYAIPDNIIAIFNSKIYNIILADKLTKLDYIDKNSTLYDFFNITKEQLTDTALVDAKYNQLKILFETDNQLILDLIEYIYALFKNQTELTNYLNYVTKYDSIKQIITTANKTYSIISNPNYEKLKNLLKYNQIQKYWLKPSKTLFELDIFGNFFDNNNFLFLLDFYSKYIQQSYIDGNSFKKTLDKFFGNVFIINKTEADKNIYKQCIYLIVKLSEKKSTKQIKEMLQILDNYDFAEPIAGDPDSEKSEPEVKTKAREDEAKAREDETKARELEIVNKLNFTDMTPMPNTTNLSIVTYLDKKYVYKNLSDVRLQNFITGYNSHKQEYYNMIFQRHLKSPLYLVSDEKNEIDGFLMIYLDKYYNLDNGKKDDSNPIIQLFSLDTEITKSYFIIILLQIINGFLNIYASNLKPCSQEIMINDNFNIQIIGLDNLTFCDGYSERDCIEVLNDIFRNINDSFKETDIYKTFFDEGSVIRNKFQYINDISSEINELIRLNVYLQVALEHGLPDEDLYHGLPGDLGHGLPGDLGHGLPEELSEKSEELSEELKDNNKFSFNNTTLKIPIKKLKKIKKNFLKKKNTGIIYNLYKKQKDKNEKYLLRRLLDKPDSNHLENYLYYEYFLSNESLKELQIKINKLELIIVDVKDITYIQNIKLIVLYVFYARSIKNTLYQDLLKIFIDNSFDDIGISSIILRKMEPIKLTDLIDTLYNLYQIEDKEKFKKKISDFIMSEDIKYPSDLIHKSKLRNNSICNTIYMKPDKNKFSLFSNTIFDIDETKIHDFQKYIDSIAPLIIQKQTKKIKKYVKKSKKSKK